MVLVAQLTPEVRPMSEVLVQFALVVAGPTGRTYVPRACGRVMEDGRRWEGWIEFVPEDSGAVLRTSQETVQPNRDDLRYWATGLTDTYLEGALERALEPPPVVPVPAVPARSAFEGPAPPTVHVPATPAAPDVPRAVLDPFRVYAQGEEVLRQELTALAPAHLRTIIRFYGLVDESTLDIEKMSRAGLSELIVAAVRKRYE
jgi:hypothetical protein